MAAHAAGSAVLDVRVRTLKQLFNEMDPSPFRERDLDRNAEEYIVEWARELPADTRLGLTVSLDQEAATPEATAALQHAVMTYFAERARSTRRSLRQLLRIGRISLLIGLVFLAAALVLGDLVAGLFDEDDYGAIAREGLVIGGWVAMWRPLEIFLYEWWPIRGEARLYDRLSAMPVEVVQGAPAPASIDAEGVPS